MFGFWGVKNLSSICLSWSFWSGFQTNNWIVSKTVLFVFKVNEIWIAFKDSSGCDKHRFDISFNGFEWNMN